MTSWVSRRAGVLALLAAVIVSGCSDGDPPSPAGRGGSGPAASGGKGGGGGAGGASGSGGASGVGTGGSASGGSAGSGGAVAGTGGGGGAIGDGSPGEMGSADARDGLSPMEVAADAGAAEGGAVTCAAGASGFDTAVAGIALDRKTCLAWERQDPVRDVSGCPLNIRDSQSKLCFSEATKYCAALRLDGKADWRLPTVKELQTIVVAGNAPALDRTIFPQAIPSIYWSAEQSGTKVIGVDFSNAGMVNPNIGPDGPQGLRCVRGPVPAR
jgi:hypothetical protein